MRRLFGSSLLVIAILFADVSDAGSAGRKVSNFLKNATKLTAVILSGGVTLLLGIDKLDPQVHTSPIKINDSLEGVIRMNELRGMGRANVESCGDLVTMGM